MDTPIGRAQSRSGRRPIAADAPGIIASVDVHTGKLPVSLVLGEEQLSRQATLAPFVQAWLADADVDHVEAQLAAVCERGDQAERVAYFRCLARANGKLNGQGEAWLARLAGY
jgi:hypothetical protein